MAAYSQNLGYRAYSKINPNRYIAARKEYQQEAVQFLLDKLAVLSSNSPLVILELGAGTGMFTKVMADVLKGSKIKIIASDPSENMVKTFRETLPEIECQQFPAQAIDLPDESVHAVVAANALHWFAESKESFDEIGRVLVPGGSLGIFFHTHDYRMPWYAEMVDYLQPLYRERNTYFLGSPWGKEYFLSKVKESGKFQKVEGQANLFPYDVQETYESSYKLFSSLSVMTVADEKTKLAMKDHFDEVIKRLFTDKGKDLQSSTYISDIYWCEKKL